MKEFFVAYRAEVRLGKEPETVLVQGIRRVLGTDEHNAQAQVAAAWLGCQSWCVGFQTAIVVTETTGA